MNRPALTAEVVAQRLEALGGLARLGQSLLGARGIRISREVFQRRSLGIQGRLTRQALRRVRAGLPPEQPGLLEIPVFASRASIDFHVGREFDALVPATAEADAAFHRAVLVGVTQQYAKPWDFAPRGWQTVCVVRFPGGIPPLIESLPELEAWSNSAALWLGTRWDVERLEPALAFREERREEA